MEVLFFICLDSYFNGRCNLFRIESKVRAEENFNIKQLLSKYTFIFKKGTLTNLLVNVLFFLVKMNMYYTDSSQKGHKFTN